MGQSHGWEIQALGSGWGGEASLERRERKGKR